jgi:hypothetical protein
MGLHPSDEGSVYVAAISKPYETYALSKLIITLLIKELKNLPGLIQLKQVDHLWMAAWRREEECCQWLKD